MCIASGFAQSLSLVGEEFLIKGQLSIIEYMAMIGFGGAIAASVQLLVYIRSGIANSLVVMVVMKSLSVTIRMLAA